jgi:glycerophosphoryl diester phosphodiesterase
MSSEASFRPVERSSLRRWTRWGGALLLLTSTCGRAPEETTPSFPDGGLLRIAEPLGRDSLMDFEGMFDLSAGQDLFGPDVAIRTSPGTVSILSGKDAGYAVLGAGCLSDGRLVVEGYWRYPRVTDAGLIRLFVEPPETAELLCAGERLPAGTPVTLSGASGDKAEHPSVPLKLSRVGDLRPWRGKFFVTAHHGACEITDSCGISPNTVETIRLAEQVGSNAIEVDVRATRDGVPILFHDPSLTGSGTLGTFCIGKVDELSLAELRANCQLVHGELIPTLEEALYVMVEQTELEGAYLDMKVGEAIAPAMDLAAAANERALAIGRTFKAVVGMPTQVTIDAWNAGLAQGRARPPCLVECAPEPCTDDFDPNIVSDMGCYLWGPTWTGGPLLDHLAVVRANGGGVIYWTLNEQVFIDQFLLQARPNGIITARGALAFYRYQKIGSEPPPFGPDVAGGEP